MRRWGGANYTYNAANQLTSGGAEYDANGNMTSDGVNSYTWDRANRLLSMGGASYQYDGEGRRVQQTVSSVVTKYLLDIQPSLAVVLSETTGANMMRYVHSPRGIHSHKDTGGNWEWMVQDGLGSVREVVDNTVSVLESRNYDPYGNPFGATGTSQTDYGYSGEPNDINGLVHDRTRYMSPSIGQFISLDTFEGVVDSAMSLNRYAYVKGNPINSVDPTGRCNPALETLVYNATESLKITDGVLRSLNGSIPTAAANVACAVSDGFETLSENQEDVIRTVEIGGALYNLTGFTLSAGTMALTITGGALAIGLGLFVYIGLTHPPVPYTPEQLRDMRPATPPAPTPQPAPSSTSTPAPSSTPTPAPVPTPTCGIPTQRTGIPQINVDTSAAISVTSGDTVNGTIARSQFLAYVAGKQLVMTTTALSEFNPIFSRFGGPTEKALCYCISGKRNAYC